MCAWQADRFPYRMPSSTAFAALTSATHHTTHHTPHQITPQHNTHHHTECWCGGVGCVVNWGGVRRGQGCDALRVRGTCVRELIQPEIRVASVLRRLAQLPSTLNILCIGGEVTGVVE